MDCEELKKKENLLEYIEKNCIGNSLTCGGPFGRRRVTYCDYTASGRALKFIEKYIQEEVLPHYGNTHTTTTVTSLQTTLFRHEARDIIRKAVNATEEDVIIFVGSGVTGAIHKLIHALHLPKPPVVFVSPFEHHSNLLSWVEIGAEIIWVEEDESGMIDIADLEKRLKEYENCGRPLIGSFTAASNITGIITDVNAVATCLHKYGAYAFFDFATAGPYVKINMNPESTESGKGLAYKDAVFVSPHKFVGGPETPGLLLAKKHLFTSHVPSEAGGGTVVYVTHEKRFYLDDIEEREEGGTPAIVESIRAGLVFQLKEAVGYETIMRKEEDLTRLARSCWENCPNLILLGDTVAEKLPIFSFLIRHPESGRFLHHNFVCVLLNDLFGIQARGGCACAAPYAWDLLGINEKAAVEIGEIIMKDMKHIGILKPGFSRLNFPFFMSSDGVQFIIEAVRMLAEHGWKLLPQYWFDPQTGDWRHKKRLTRLHQISPQNTFVLSFPHNRLSPDNTAKEMTECKLLSSISYASGKMSYPAVHEIGKAPKDYKHCLKMASEIFEQAGKVQATKCCQSKQLKHISFSKEAERYRWFLLPEEAQQCLAHDVPCENSFRMPFCPRKSAKESKGHSKYKMRPGDECVCNNGEDHARPLKKQERTAKQRSRSDSEYRLKTTIIQEHTAKQRSRSDSDGHLKSETERDRSVEYWRKQSVNTSDSGVATMNSSLESSDVEAKRGENLGEVKVRSKPEDTSDDEVHEFQSKKKKRRLFKQKDNERHLEGCRNLRHGPEAKPICKLM